jgi:hypothetical protein
MGYRFQGRPLRTGSMRAWRGVIAAGSKAYTLGVGGTTVDTTSTTSTGPGSLAWSTSAADNGHAWRP